MRLASVIALAAIGTTLVALASPADAQQRRPVRGDQSERITWIDETGRVRTRVTVRPRSFLDGGTEVFPGERKFMDYAFPPTYMNGAPNANWDPTGSRRFPLPMPYELPGFNPFSW